MLLFWFSSFSYSQYYEPVYEVDGVGPNGGRVISVDVTSALTDTFVELVGDFEETTYTYEYTETIVEELDEVTQVTQTVITSVKSSNLIPTDWDYQDTNINVVGNSYGMNGAEFTTGSQSMSGGTRIYEGDLSFDNMDLLEYGATVYSHSSNSSVPACANTTSDCRDDFSIVVKLYNDGELVETQSHVYQGITWTGSRDYDYSLDISEMDVDYGSLALYGIDRGYPSGYYGPGFSDVYVYVTYDVISQVVNDIVTTIERETILKTDVYVYESVYIPPVVDVQITHVTPTEFEVEVVQIDDFGIESIESFEVELEVSNLAPAEIEMEIAQELEFTPLEVDDTESDSGEVFTEVQEVNEEVAADEPEPEPMESETEEPEQEQEQQQEEETEPEPEQEVEAVEEQQQQEEEEQQETEKPRSSGYSVALDSVKVALMVQNAASRAFAEYQQERLPDAAFYPPRELDGGETVDNPLGRWMTGASDLLMREMVDSQWQR